MRTIIGKQNQFHIRGITAIPVTPRNVQLMSVTSSLVTDVKRDVSFVRYINSFGGNET